MPELRHIYKSFGGNTVLTDLSAVFPDGKVTAVLGSSGCGKTTMLRILSGLTKPDSGEVIGAGDKRVSYVFQEDRLFSSFSAMKNLLAVGGDRAAALACLRETGLEEYADTKAGVLSGGMKRRLAIARAIFFDGDIFYLDEPIRELDDENADKMRRLLKSHLAGKTAVLITHSREEAEFLAGNIIKMGEE